MYQFSVILLDRYTEERRVELPDLLDDIAMSIELIYELYGFLERIRLAHKVTQEMIQPFRRRRCYYLRVQGEVSNGPDNILGAP